jgi:hypothetical protein
MAIPIAAAGRRSPCHGNRFLFDSHSAQTSAGRSSVSRPTSPAIDSLCGFIGFVLFDRFKVFNFSLCGLSFR